MPSVKNCTYNIRTEAYYQYEYRTYTQDSKKKKYNQWVPDKFSFSYLS